MDPSEYAKEKSIIEFLTNDQKASLIQNTPGVYNCQRCGKSFWGDIIELHLGAHSAPREDFYGDYEDDWYCYHNEHSFHFAEIDTGAAKAKVPSNCPTCGQFGMPYIINHKCNDALFEKIENDYSGLTIASEEQPASEVDHPLRNRDEGERDT